MQFILKLRAERHGKARSAVIDEGLMSDSPNVSMRVCPDSGEVKVITAQ